MTEPFQFADKLNEYVRRSAYTPGQLANLARLPRTTIVNWLNGRVQRPRDWQPLVKLLVVLHLDENEADEVLRAANQPAIAELRLLAQAEPEAALLTAWKRPLPPPSPASQPPFQAIPDMPYFVGRQAILSQLKTQLLATDGASICTLQGMAGTGKTALAARIAYQLRSRFPDGVLWARLDTSDTMTILHTFAQAYGADVSQYADVASRSRVVRGLLADKRAFIVLDNAPDSTGVEPLLPPTGQCAVLITTRRHDLRVAQGGYRLTLPPFDANGGASQQLLAHFLGDERAAKEADLLAEMAAQVGHLPLALAIIAGRLAYEPGWSTADFLARIRQASRRLKELQSEDQSVRLSFAASYALLPDEMQPFFAALSLFGGEDFSPEAAAATANVPLEDAQDYLRSLYRLSLVQSGRAGRYQLHPLLRDYAREQLDDPLARTRLANYFIDFLERRDPGAAELAVEYGNILAVIAEAQAGGETAVAIPLIIALAPFLKMQGLYDVAQRQLTYALAAAPTEQQLPILLHLTQIARYYRRYDDADGYLATAVPLAQKQKDTYHLSAIEAEKGIIAGCQGDYSEARHHFQEGLILSRQHNQPALLIPLLKELGASEVTQGQYEQAETYYQEALALAQQTSPVHAPMLLRCLGSIAIIRDHDFALAGALYKEGLHKARTMNSQEDMILLLNNLAVVAFQTGDVARAKDLLMEGLTLARRLFHQVGMGMITGNLGRLSAHEGEWEAAEQYLEEGLAVVTAVAHHELIIAFHYSLGLLFGRQQKYQQADHHFQTAVAQAQKIKHRSWTLQALKGWAWLYLAQKGTGVGNGFAEAFQGAAAAYDLTQSPDEFAASNGITSLEEGLKIFYD